MTEVKNNTPKETDLFLKNSAKADDTSIPGTPATNDRTIDFDLSEIEYETDEEITFGEPPIQGDDNPGESHSTTPPNITEQIGLIAGKLDLLKQEFNEKLKYDHHKDTIIDNLHSELQEYKNETFRKHFQTMIMDVIKIIDDIRKLSRFYREQESLNSDPDKMLKLIESIPADLEDSFYWQGVKPYIVDSDHFDPTQQKVLKKIETTDKIKDKMIAERLFPGYEWDGRVIRPEMVNVYLYVENSPEINFRSTDE